MFRLPQPVMVKCVAVIQDYYRKAAKVQVKVPGRPWAEQEAGAGQGAGQYDYAEQGTSASHSATTLHTSPAALLLLLILRIDYS